jgi:hypothetical protein
MRALSRHQLQNHDSRRPARPRMPAPGSLEADGVPDPVGRALLDLGARLVKRNVGVAARNATASEDPALVLGLLALQHANPIPFSRHRRCLRLISRNLAPTSAGAGQSLAGCVTLTRMVLALHLDCGRGTGRPISMPSGCLRGSRASRSRHSPWAQNCRRPPRPPAAGREGWLHPLFPRGFPPTTYSTPD